MKFHKSDSFSSDNSIIEDSLSMDGIKPRRIDFLEDLNDRYIERTESNSSRMFKNILDIEEKLKIQIEEILSSVYDSYLYENKQVDITQYEKNVI